MSESSAARALRAVRREEEYIAAQRSESSLQRAAFLSEAASVLGSQSAVARALGTSVQAVNKALKKPDDDSDLLPLRYRPLAHIPIRLSEPGRAGWGQDVPLADEWEELRGTPEAQPAAERAADTWRTSARVTAHLEEMVNAMAASVMVALDLTKDEPDDLAALREEIREEASGQSPDIPVPGSRAEAEAIERLLHYISAGLRRYATGAWKEAEVWEERAGRRKPSSGE